MSRIGTEFNPNLSLAIALICELTGISKSQFLRMATLEFAYQMLRQESTENINNQVKSLILKEIESAISNFSDVELSPQFKKAFLDKLVLLRNNTDL